MIRSLVLASLVLALAGCSGSAPVRYYTLMPVETGAASRSAGSGSIAGTVISVGPVSIPTALDQPQFVVSKGAQEVDVDEDHRWSAPLKDEISGALVARLSGLLAGATVAEYSHSAARDENLRVLVDVTRFTLAPGGQVVLDALWTLKRKSGESPLRGRTSLTVAGQGTAHGAWAAAGGKVLDALARDVADAVKRPGTL